MRKLLLIITVLSSFYLSAQETGRVIFENTNSSLTRTEKKQIEEVFGNHTKELVYNRPSTVRDYKDILRNRVRVMYVPYEKYKLSPKYTQATTLTELGLYNVYNPNLTIDPLTIAPKDLNLLKYKINFFPQKNTMYKHGDNFIFIYPQKHETR